MPISISGSGTITGASSFSSNTIFGGSVGVSGAVNTSSNLLVSGQANVDYIYAKTAGSRTYMPGHVIQVQQTVYTSTFTTTSGYVTVFGVNITPTLSSSKILVSCSVLRCGDSWNNGRAFTSIWRNEATNLIWQTPNNWAATQGDTNSNTYTVALEYLDSPATTSQITYNVRIAPGTNGYVAVVNRTVGSATAEASGSVITAMEVAQ